MTLRQRFRFLHWFAIHDLFEPAARPTTIVNRRSIALVTTLTVASFGVLLAAREVSLARVRDQPLSRCLTIGNPNIVPQFTPQRLARLTEALDNQPRLAKAYSGPFPFQVLDFEWRPIDRPGQSLAPRAMPFVGRTVKPGSNDPLLRLLGNLGEGVLATRSMIESLYGAEKPPEKLPAQLTMELPTGAFNVPLAGVIDLALPEGQQFVLTEAYEAELRGVIAGGRARLVYSGEAPKDWGDNLFNLPASISAKLAEVFDRPEYAVIRIGRSVRKSISTGKEVSVWDMESGRGDPPSMDTWRRLMETVRDIIEDGSYSKGPDFVPRGMIDAPDAQRVAPATREGFSMASIYVDDLSGLEPAADAAATQGFPVLRDVIQRLREIDGRSRMTLGGIILVTGLLLFNSCANLHTIQKLRAEQKLTEIGMLKAMGMDAGLLAQVHLYEATTVWLGGTIRGLILGLLTAAGLCWWFVAQTRQDMTEFFFGRWFLLALILIPLVTCLAFLASSWFGTRTARKASPIVTLKSN